LFGCPQCGDGSVQFPETCETAGGGTSCSVDGKRFCDARCRSTVCDDGNPCLHGTCDAALGCQHTQEPDGTSCSDATVCNGTEACVQCQCQHAGIACDDGLACTTDACNPATGACTATPISGCQACADASTCPNEAPVDNPCTDPACVFGRCEQIPSDNCCQADADCVDID